MNNKAPVVVRFAPSPTGALHVGSARTALFNYLFAKKENGIFFLRIEDTDRERSKKEFEEDIVRSLSWLSLSYDAFYRQSDAPRKKLYRDALELLVKNGKAYVSKEEQGTGKREEVIRFKNIGTRITFNDMIRGEISMDTSDLGDFVIAKDFDSPLYHLAVVVDDAESAVTHIIRGEDGIANTPRQILLQKALGYHEPHYAHLPLILAPDRSKLSKRHGAVSISEFQMEGYLPETMINFLALLGWHPEDERELFTKEELAERFSLEHVQKGGAIFDTVKLRWMNKEYLSRLPYSEFEKLVREKYPSEFPLRSKKTLALVQERIETLSDIQRLLAEEGELGFLKKIPAYDTKRLEDPKTTPGNEETKKHLCFIHNTLKDIKPENFTHPHIKNAVWDYATKEGRGKVLWPMRYALTGQERSPDPFTAAEVLEKEETLKRIHEAIKRL